MVKKSYYNTEIKTGKGAGRVCEFYPMGKVNEKAIEWKDGENYTLHIKPIEKLPFLKKDLPTSHYHHQAMEVLEFLWILNTMLLLGQ